MKTIKAKETKQLSKIKFEPLNLEFNLGSEITGNLRGIKPQGSILGDRFNSMQKRNVIEPAMKRRYVSSYFCICTDFRKSEKMTLTKVGITYIEIEVLKIRCYMKFQ